MTKCSLKLSDYYFLPSQKVSLQTSLKFSDECVSQVSGVPGIEFGDNGGHKYVTEQNGVAEAVIEVGTDKKGIS